MSVPNATLNASLETDGDVVELEESNRRREQRARWGRVITYVVLSLSSLIMLFPFLWMISNSLAPTSDLFSYPPKFIPSDPQWGNYSEAFAAVGLGRALWNSLLIAAITTATVLVFDSLAGYAFAKMNFPGRTTAFITVLVTAMIPIQVTMIPLFIMFRKMPFAGGNNALGEGGTGLINTYPALILPFVVTTFGTYFMREAFRMVPSTLLDAARVDGHSEWTIFWRVYMPLVKPSLAAIGLFHFTFVWNEFLIPLIMTNEAEMRTVQVALSAFKGQYFDDWNILMAATAVAALPPFLVFLFGQRQFVKGMAMTGVRGG
jgi:multiple sugar transport system permease protein